MCGKDGAQRGVYKQKEEHEEWDRDRKTREKEEKRRERRKGEEKKSSNLKPLTFLRVTFWEGRPELT